MMLLFFILFFGLAAGYIGEVFLDASCKRWGDHLRFDTVANLVCYLGAAALMLAMLALTQLLIEAI